MTIDWVPLLKFPIEWSALALFVVACLYWERAGYSGLGVEGCIAAAAIGFIAGYDATGSYWGAAGIAAAAAVAFAVSTGILLHVLRTDPAVGAFAASLVAVCGLGILVRAGSHALLTQQPPPGLIGGTVFGGTVGEDLLANPWFYATPFAVALGSWMYWRTPFGLRLRAFGETPALRLPGASATRTRWIGLAVGALFVVPGVALLLRVSGGAPPVALGILALACAIAGRWAFAPALLLASLIALLRTLRAYAGGSGAAAVGLDIAPFALALLMLVIFSRRSLRMTASRQARLDPDTL